MKIDRKFVQRLHRESVNKYGIENLKDPIVIRTTERTDKILLSAFAVMIIGAINLFVSYDISTPVEVAFHGLFK